MDFCLNFKLTALKKCYYAFQLYLIQQPSDNKGHSLQIISKKHLYLSLSYC